MRFRTYPKIGGTAESTGGTWVATEKIHGANFVVAVDRLADAVVFGKRKDWLTDDAAFFGWQLIARDLAERARSLARDVDAAQVVCYGELFGGEYPHPDVDAMPGLSAVQTGIYYAPDLRWAMFDVLVAGSDDDDGELLAHAEIEALAASAGILVPPVIARGRYGDLDRWPVEAESGVPALLGLPPLAKNLREGFVAKPDRRFSYGERPIAKRKLADFDDARFDGAEAWAPGHLDRDALASWGVRLVNPARVASARSKVGEDRAEIVDEIVLDVGADLETVFPGAWRSLGDGETIVLQAVRDAARRELGLE